MTPTVSIVLPTYTRAHILKKSIDSILAQSYTDFELIIADDCSKDNTKELVDSYQDSRIKYFYSEKNLGAAGARNFGASKATAPYLAFQDSDTVWCPNKLELQMQYLKEHPEVSLVACSYFLEGKTRILEPDQTYLQQLSSYHIFYDLLVKPLIGTPTILMDSNAFHSIGGFNNSLRSHEDYEFSLRVAKSYQISFIKEPLLYAYQLDASVNANYHEILRTNYYILNLYKDIYSSHPDFENAMLDRLFSYAILGNEGQYFFDELASYVISTNRRELYYHYEKQYNDLLKQLEDKY